MAGRLSDYVTGQKRFLGDVAHELSAPIARIQTAQAILSHKIEAAGNQSTDDAGGSAHETILDVEEEVEHLTDLVNELLQFSKAALRPGEIRLEPVDVSATVKRVALREAGARGVVRVDVPEGLRALANPSYFSRSIGNLVRNALRYAGDAGPVEVTAEQQGEEIVIAVADRGPGIRPDELERIFEPFYRPEQSRSRDSGGMGLGLAIVKAGMESCGGSVSCRNRQPHGLEVTLRVPRAAD